MSAAYWSHVNAYLTQFMRASAEIARTVLAGTAELIGTGLIGSGTAFGAELSVGAWIAFDAAPGLAYQIDEIIDDATAVVRQSGTVAVSGVSRLNEDVHDQTLRSDQGDRRLLIRTYFNRTDFCKLREIRFQVLASAPDNAAARELAATVNRIFPEGSFEMLAPAGAVGLPDLHARWVRKESEHDLGETTSGRREISLNFLLRGDEG